MVDNGNTLSRTTMMSSPMNNVLGLPKITPQAASQGTYMGSNYSYTPGAAATTPGGKGTSAAPTVSAYDTFIPDNMAWAGYGTLDEMGQKRLNVIMNAAHPNGWNAEYFKNTWSSGVMMSQAWTRLKGERVSPLDALWRFYVGKDQTIIPPGSSSSSSSSGRGSRSGGGYSGPVTSTVTSSSTKLTDPDSAMSLVDQSLQNFLGRRATPQEQQAFLAALNRHERANPTVTRQVSTTTPSGHNTSTTQNANTRGGSDAAAFAQQWGAAQEGASEYAAATTFLDAFIGSLKNPVG